jgi:hypothetical protein
MLTNLNEANKMNCKSISQSQQSLLVSLRSSPCRSLLLSQSANCLLQWRSVSTLQLNLHETTFTEFGLDSDPLASVEQWMNNQRHEPDTWLLREILAYKCRAKETTAKTSTNAPHLPIPQALLECLLQTLIMMRRENERLVEKSKEQLTNARLDKVQDERFESLHEQLIIKNELIADLKADVALWQEKYLGSIETNQRLIEQTNSTQIECSSRMSIVQKANEDLQALVQQTEKESQSLQTENRRLSGELFKVQAEVEAFKKSVQSTETLRKERLCCQQKVHVVSERLFQCKEKLNEFEAEARHREALSELQTQQVQHLQGNVNQLRSAYDQLTQDSESCRLRAEEAEKRVADLEREADQNASQQQSRRSAELQLQRETLNSLLSINSAYEAELFELRAKLALFEYELKQTSPARPNRGSSGDKPTTVICAVDTESP